MPKTIDNDLGATDYTFGFDTAVNIAMEAIDRLHTTAESHHRTLVVEVMGRHAGWIALHAGLAGGANVILLPERKFDVEQVAGYVEKRFQHQYAPIVVVAEGAQPLEGQMVLHNQELDSFGHVRLGGIGQWLAEQLEAKTGKEARTVVLGSHPARRHPDRLRPGARHPVRAAARSTRCTTATGARWSPCTAPTSSGCRWPRRPASSRPCPLERYTEAEVFFGS